MTMLKLFTPPRPARGGGSGRLRLFVAAFVVCALLDLVCEATGRDGPAAVFRALDIPLLAGALFTARPPLDRTVALVVGALLFSWLGDTVGGVDNLAKIGLFLAAQWFFAAAFWPYRRRSLLQKPVALLGYAVMFLVLLGVLAGPAGDLALPVLVYGFSLTVMAVLASGLNRRATIGGLLFMVSDTLLGVQWFYRPRADDLTDFMIMLSYLAAEGLLVWGTVAAARSRQMLRNRPGSAPAEPGI